MPCGGFEKDKRIKMSVLSSKNVNMTEGKILPSVIKYAMPIVFGGILQILFNSADLAVVGNFSQSKTTAAAAVGATGAFISLIVNFCIGFSTGVNVVLARSIGGGDDEKTRKTVHTSLIAALIFGFIVLAAGCATSDIAMTLTDCPAASHDMAVSYLIIYFLGAPGIMLYNFGAAILRSKGDTQRPLNFLIVAGVANVILNLIFVAGFKMEAAGVALATTLTQYLAAFLTLRCLANQNDAVRLDFKLLKISRTELFEVLKYGFPNGMANVMFSISNLQIQSAINSYGEAAVNGNAAMSSIEGFLMSGCSGFNATAVAFVGQNLGAGKKDRVRKSIFAIIGSAVTYTVLLGYTMFAFAEPLLKIFNASDPEVIRYGIMRGSIMMRFYFEWGLSNALAGALHAFGRSNLVMTNSFLSICVFRVIWMNFIYPSNRTFKMIYWCYPISMGITITVYLVGLYLVVRKYRKYGVFK